MRAARLNSPIRSFVRWCGWSLQKQILSAGDLLGVMPMPSGSYLRVLGGYAASARFGTSLVKEVPTTQGEYG